MSESQLEPLDENEIASRLARIRSDFRVVGLPDPGRRFAAVLRAIKREMCSPQSVQWVPPPRSRPEIEAEGGALGCMFRLDRLEPDCLFAGLPDTRAAIQVLVPKVRAALKVWKAHHPTPH